MLSYVCNTFLPEGARYIFLKESNLLLLPRGAIISSLDVWIITEGLIVRREVMRSQNLKQ